MQKGQFVTPLDGDDNAVYIFKGNPQGYRNARMRSLRVDSKNMDTIIGLLQDIGHGYNRFRNDSVSRGIVVTFKENESAIYYYGDTITFVYDSQYNPIGVMR